MKSHRILMLACVVCLSTVIATADDFRVETDIFIDEQTQPSDEILTIFFGDVVYDFMLSRSREITIFDVRRGRIVMMDPNREVKAEVNTAELTELTAAIRATSLDRGDEPLFATSFSHRTDEATGDIVLEGGRLTYTAKGVRPKHETAVHRYREFADWYARLNAARPGNPPPFGRLELNRHMAEAGILPEVIRRTLNLPGRIRDDQQAVRSQHAFTWLLSNTDRKRINDAGKYLVEFESVTLADYWLIKK